MEGMETEMHVTQERLRVGAAGLSVLLGQVVTYFSGRAQADDLDVLSFSLHHLFCGVDYVYRTALPELMSVSPTVSIEPAEMEIDDLLRQQHIWTKLRAMKHTMNRLEPLCNLLNDACG